MHHLQTITHLLLGAAHLARPGEHEAAHVVDHVLRTVLGADATPPRVAEALDAFASAYTHDVTATGAELSGLPDRAKRRILELIAAVHPEHVDVDFAEDVYLRSVATAMGIEGTEYDSLGLQAAPVEEFEGLFDDLEDDFDPSNDDDVRELGGEG